MKRALAAVHTTDRAHSLAWPENRDTDTSLCPVLYVDPVYQRRKFTAFTTLIYIRVYIRNLPANRPV